ncbi:MAG TPA: FAD-dependent oxidoreductase [Longimicrobiales bacterium]|nr:FAD-dependent oxidoreductase [Longimicrobiales bacterium]
MARSPLFHLLRRTLRQSWSNQIAAHEPGSGFPEVSGSRRTVSRRDFLRTSGLAAAGLSLGGCGVSFQARGAPVTDEPVLVVGGGIAGLTAAWRLTQAGVPVRVLEAQDRTGGRMFSLRGHFPDDQVAELGGELIDSGHTAIRGLARELHIEIDDLHVGETMEPEWWWFEGRRIGEAELLAAWAPVAARIGTDLGTLGTLGEWPWVTYANPNGAEVLDRTSLAEWLARVEMEGWFRSLLDVGFTTEYGLEVDHQSVLNLHFLIDPAPDAFVIYGESDERYHVRGGNDRIPTELAARLGDRIETGARVEAVRRRPDGVYAVSVRRDSSSTVETARHVILALPFTLLREVELDVDLPPAKRRAIDELGYGTNAKLMMGFDRRVWRDAHGSAGSVLSSLPFQLVWETSRGQPGAHGILTNFTGGEQGVAVGQGTPREQAQRVVAELEGVWPGIRAAHRADDAVRFHWPTHAWTRGSYACYLPGQWTGISGAEGEPVEGLHFAGEHCSLEAQGFMEGGCETGERAAREVLAALGSGVTGA